MKIPQEPDAQNNTLSFIKIAGLMMSLLSFLVDKKILEKDEEILEDSLRKLRTSVEPCTSIMNILPYDPNMKEYFGFADYLTSFLDVFGIAFSYDSARLAAAYVCCVDDTYKMIVETPDRQALLSDLQLYVEENASKTIIYNLAELMVKHVEFDDKYRHLLTDADLDSAEFDLPFVRQIEALPEERREPMIKKFLQSSRSTVENSLVLAGLDFAKFKESWLQLHQKEPNQL